ncbi:cation:proton antiporter [Pseudonocardia lacus]|uniref:cation:proton antiporter n=1 Tax=Pseudonocardia lacus TaxID=2835865 RepID=UPI001BDD2063|nr:cation:proton antiporter [Pseudonocardia lacus]
MIVDDVGVGQILDSLLAVAVVAVLAPLLLGLVPRIAVPQVVLLLAGGLAIGPQAMALADPRAVQPLADVGLGFVFLLAGYEIDQRLVRRDAGRRALLAWAVSAVLALGIVAGLDALGIVRAYVPVAIALTTTAFGTLLPVLRDAGLLRGRLGGYLLAGGAVGELLPILAIALFLGATNRWVALASLASVAAIAVLLSALPRLLRRAGRIARVVAERQHETNQITLRATVLLLVLLLAVTDQVHLDAVLGAFVAGMVLRRWAGDGAPVLEEKLDVIAYGFFVPLFFVYSGMTIDLRSIASAPLLLLLFAVLLVVVRGLPALLVYRRVLPPRGRVQVALITATALPLLVALAQIGLRNGTMLPGNAAALVGAGVLTVLVLPTIAVALHRLRPEPEPEPSRAAEG